MMIFSSIILIALGARIMIMHSKTGEIIKVIIGATIMFIGIIVMFLHFIN